MEIQAYLVSVNGVTVFIGNPFAHRFLEHAGALNRLVIGCILLAVGEIAALGDAKTETSGFQRLPARFPLRCHQALQGLFRAERGPVQAVL